MSAAPFGREPDRHRQHIDAIGGLRALAVLSVVAYHIDPSWLPGGFVGVDVFFTISGFVVAHSVYDSGYPSFRAFYAHFYRRRFQRILPAAYLYIVAALILSVLVIPLASPTRTYEPAGAAAALAVSNVFLFLTSGDYFAESSDLNPFTHTWSLAVEEQYYLVFPAFAYLMLAAGRASAVRRGRIAAALAGACALSLASAALLSVRAPVFAFYMLPTRFWELGLGFFLRYLLTPAASAAVAHRLGRAGTLLACAGLLGLALAFAVTPVSGFPFPGAVLPCVATALVIGTSWCLAGNSVDRLLATRVPVFFGAISYSLYLWHWGVLVAMRWTVGIDTLALKLTALALSVASGWLSYRLVEQRFHGRTMRGRAPSARFFLGYAGATIALCATCGLLMLGKPRVGLAASNRTDVWSPYVRPPLPAGCAAERRVTRLAGGEEIRFPASCARPGLPRLWVFGDSHAGAYQRLLWRLAAEGRVEPVLFTLGGCRLVYVTRTPPVPGCDAFRTVVEHRLRTLARAGDVILLPGLHVARYGSPFWAEPPDLSVIATSRVRVAALLRTGATVLVEGPKAVMPVSQYRCADWFNARNPACRAGAEVPDAARWRHMMRYEPALRAVVTGLPGAALWEPGTVLCPGQRCPGFLDGKPLYFDTDHLTAYADDLLLRPLATAVYARAGRGPAPVR